MRWTRDRLTAWLAGGLFVASAVLTEAVSGVVGIADVLGGTGRAPRARSRSASACRPMPLALLGATLLGLYSKESALCIVPLVPFAALLDVADHPPGAAAALGPRGCRGRRCDRRGVRLLRRDAPPLVPRWRPRPSSPPRRNAHKPARCARLRRRAPLVRAADAAARSAEQPAHRRDDAAPHRRRAARLRARPAQVVFPCTLSGDYSAPQEPIPDRLVFPESVLGARGDGPAAPRVPVLALVAWRRVARRGRSTRRPARLDARGRRPHAASWRSRWCGSSSRTSRSRTSPSSCRRCARSASGTSPPSARHPPRHRLREARPARRAAAGGCAGGRGGARALPRLPVLRRAPARVRLHERPRLLGRDAQGRPAEREGAPQLLRHARRARRPAAGSSRTPSRSISRRSGRWRASTWATRCAACTARPRRGRTTCAASSSARTT